jgi:hypothetical protein
MYATVSLMAHATAAPPLLQLVNLKETIRVLQLMVQRALGDLAMTFLNGWEIEAPKVGGRPKERESHLLPRPRQRLDGSNPTLLLFLRCHVDDEQGFADLNWRGESNQSAVSIYDICERVLMEGPHPLRSSVNKHGQTKWYPLATSSGCERLRRCDRSWLSLRAWNKANFSRFDWKFLLDTVDRAFKMPSRS